MGSVGIESFDAVIVGAGFNGLHCLHELRKHGFSAVVFEAGAEMGGTWYLNRYPGARVDSEYPIYQLSQMEISKDFPWSERFPGYAELRKYFHHIDQRHNFSKDIRFNTVVTGAEFNDSSNQWLVKTDKGQSVWGSYLILCTGFASKKYTPDFPGLEKFKGICYHTHDWPKEGVDVEGKRVSIIGTGASGVQVIQEIGRSVGHLTVYQRTPNLAFPMQQAFAADESSKWKFPGPADYKEIIDTNAKTFSGLGMDFRMENAMDVSDEERRSWYETLFARGGFNFWLGTFQDVLFNQEANDTAYAFWCEKTRARINDEAKKDLLAPLTPPHAIGTKRPCLEQYYYEIFNQDNVDVINVRKSPILEITEEGVRTEIEGEIEADVLILATGFDSVTGGILNINIVNGSGQPLQQKWKEGTWTTHGISTAGYPNMFFLYGPHAPTAFSNGPTTGQIQGDWIRDLMIYMRSAKKTRVDAMEEAEAEWKKSVEDFWRNSLFPATDSWYQGANIPGKVREPLNYLGGIPRYTKALEDSAKEDYKGFVIA